jgi:hypothetical protein
MELTMKSINIFTALLIFNLNQYIFCQEPDPLSFFPHSVGNIWEYDTPDGIQRYEIISDSITPDNSIIVYFNRYPSYQIDTNYNVYRLSSLSQNVWLEYKLDADSGDNWLVDIRDTSSDLKELAVLTNVYLSTVFGKERILKEITYGLSQDTIYDPNFFWVHSVETLAEGIGLVYIWNEEPPQGPQKILRGCVIDGDTSGIITSVKDNFELPEEIQLVQNYPNPFNPETTIRFQIPSYTYVDLRVFDILGKEVSNLVNEEKPAGVYEVKFNGSNLSSGTYIYVLKANNKIYSRKMTLIK